MVALDKPRLLELAGSAGFEQRSRLAVARRMSVKISRGGVSKHNAALRGRGGSSPPNLSCLL